MEKLNNFINNLRQVKLSDINLKQLTDLDYLLDRNPTEIFIYEQWIYVFVLANIFFSMIGFIYVSKLFFDSKPKYRFIRKISFFWFSNTLFLLLYNLIRSEGVRFLSMRLFLVLIPLAYLGIIIYTLIYRIFYLPGRLKKFKEAKLRDKYSNKKRR